jgi:hypothetical protein
MAQGIIEISGSHCSRRIQVAVKIKSQVCSGFDGSRKSRISGTNAKAA